jgi:hypothetical protein
MKTMAEEQSKDKLDLVGVQEVRWKKGGTKSKDYKFGFAHFWSVTLVSTNTTTLFTPPSVISYI